MSRIPGKVDDVQQCDWVQTIHYVSACERWLFKIIIHSHFGPRVARIFIELNGRIFLRPRGQLGMSGNHHDVIEDYFVCVSLARNMRVLGTSSLRVLASFWKRDCK